jgi:hypothetical protein
LQWWIEAQIFQVQKHFRGAGYNDTSADHRNHGRRWCGVARGISPARRHRGPDHIDRRARRSAGGTAQATIPP